MARRQTQKKTIPHLPEFYRCQEKFAEKFIKIKLIKKYFVILLVSLYIFLKYFIKKQL